MKKFIREFKEFALRGNVVDLAVGVIIGTAFQSIVNSMVSDVISPFIGMVAKTDFSYLSFSIRDVTVKYGAFLTAVINFLIMALIIFLFVKGMNRLFGYFNNENSKDKTKNEKECKYCCSKIDEKATRCPFCTSMLECGEEDS